MSVSCVGMSTLASIFKLFLLLIVFILILVASYFFTRWYARSGLVRNTSRNIQVVESFSMGPGKQICILRIGEKYIAVAVSKENITFLTELEGEQICAAMPEAMDASSFREVFGGMVRERFQTGGHDRDKDKNDKKGL